MTTPAARSVLAVHGNGGGAFRFARLVPHVQPALRFEAVTLPGFAQVPADPALQTLQDYAARLHERVLALPRPRVLLGHGIGGSIALEYGQHYAEALDGMILHAPVGARLDQRLFPRLMKLPGMRTAGQRVFASRLTRPLMRRLLFDEPVPADYAHQFFEEYRHCTVFGQMFDLITAPWFNGLAPIDTPTILLWGAEERVLKVEQAEAFLRLLPQGSLEIVPGWGHFPMVEHPKAYARYIDELAWRLIKGSSAAERSV
ncbi:MAG: alpha/beta hydrolase [Bacteroidota bacterium]